MMIETYDWYVAHRKTLGSEERSHHRKPVRAGVLGAARWALSIGR
jgi:hypothetical protein